MRLTDRLLVESLKAQIRPEVMAVGRRVVARERDALNYLAAYDQGQTAGQGTEPSYEEYEAPRRARAAG
jgi:hypothetical protein